MVKAPTYQTSMESGEPVRFSSQKQRYGYSLHEGRWQAETDNHRCGNRHHHPPLMNAMGPPTANAPKLQQPSSYVQQHTFQRPSYQVYQPHRSIHAPLDYDPLQHDPAQHSRKYHGDLPGQRYALASAAAPPPSHLPEHFSDVIEPDVLPMPRGYQDDPS